MADRELRVLWLYPDHMNIYADRGNIAVLERRCALARHRVRARDGRARRRRSTRTRTTSSTSAAARTATRRWSRATSSRPSARRSRRRSTRGAAMLAVCGGYQLLGHSYELPDGESLPGPRPRRPAHGARAGPAADRQRRDRGRPRRRRRSASPASRTTAAAPTSAPASSRSGGSCPGFGNNGKDGCEGVRRGRLIGTYLHGPLLPKNAWLADVLIGWALEARYGQVPRSPRSTTRSSAARTKAPCGRPGASNGRVAAMATATVEKLAGGRPDARPTASSDRDRRCCCCTAGRRRRSSGGT